MSLIARQSTARTLIVGPVLDADGVAVTDSVVADIKLAKNGAAPAALNGSATLTHRATGHYSLALTATDLDTVGQAEIISDDTVNAMPVKALTVIEEAVYDILFAASATGAVPVASIATGAITAASIAADAITDAKVASDVTIASVTGAVGSVTGAVGSVTAAVTANVTQIDGQATAGNNATLNLKQLNIVNNAGSALVASSTGSNGHGFASSGHGTGAGMRAAGGTLGPGLQAVGGSSSGEGLVAQGVADIGLRAIGGNNNPGMWAQGHGAGEGIFIVAGDTGHGAAFTGGSTSGDAIRATVTSGSKFGTLIADLWAYVTRTLTAGTNIVLAKGTGVTGFNDLDAAGVRTAVGLASANLDTQLGDLPTAEENADAALIRDWTAVSGTVADRSTLNALRHLRNKWSMAGTTLTVTEEDDTTAAWTATVTTDAAAEPITGSDPS